MEIHHKLFRAGILVLLILSFVSSGNSANNVANSNSKTQASLVSQTALGICTYTWPTAPGQALLSDKYAVTLSQNGKTTNSQVIMSNSKDIEIPDFASEFRGGRTFNWTSFSSNFTSPVTITVEKIFGTGALNVEIVPSSFGISKTISSDQKKVTFTLTKPQYVSINFKTNDNMQTSDGVVKHMMMIFADPLETDIPDKNAPGVHVYSPNSTKTDLKNASLIYFPPGYHDLSVQYKSTVSNMAEAVGNNKKIYFAGGAYVHGRIYDAKASNIKIYGRGVLSGRDFKWAKNLAKNGGKIGIDSFDPIESHIGINGSNNTIDGVIVCDGAGHGVNLGESCTYLRTKYWGWHPNNDGFRPWGNKTNIIDNCFIRTCDDALYNKALKVTNTIFWPGFNGSILCLGWDGKYSTENSVLTNNYVIYPEWRDIGNNHGIIMSQIDYDMTAVNVTIDGLYVDGNISALFNLKTNTRKSDKKDFTLPTDWTSLLGKVDNITVKNVTVSGGQLKFIGSSYTQTPEACKSLITGTNLSDGSKYMFSNITIQNVKIGNTLLTNANKDQYFVLDEETTKNIVFK